MPEAVPRVDACALDEDQHCAVLVSAAVEGDEAVLAVWGGEEGFFEYAVEFWGDWYPAAFVADVVFGLGTADVETAAFPVDISPCQDVRFTGGAESGISSQSKEETDSRGRAGGDDGVGFVGRDVAVVFGGGGAAGEMFEGVGADQAAAFCFAEETFDVADVVADGGFGDFAVAVGVAGE